MRCYVLSSGFSVQPPASVFIEMEIVVQSITTGQALILTCEINDPNWVINDEGLLIYNKSKILVEEKEKYTLLSSVKEKETNLKRNLTDVEKELLLDFIFSYCKEEIIQERSKQEDKMMTLFGMDEEDLDLLSENERNFLTKDYKK